MLFPLGFDFNLCAQMHKYAGKGESASHIMFLVFLCVLLHVSHCVCHWFSLCVYPCHWLVWSYTVYGNHALSVCTIQCSLCLVALFIVHCALFTVHFVHCSLCTMCTVQCSLSTMRRLRWNCRKEGRRQSPPRSQHFPDLTWQSWFYRRNKQTKLNQMFITHKGSCQKRFSGFFPLRGYPPPPP